MSVRQVELVATDRGMALKREDQQRFFNRAVEGLAAQGWTQSISEGPWAVCKYRGPGGKKCALGHLIPDDAYVPEMDHGTQYARVLPAIGVPYSLLGGPAQHWFEMLQASHDMGSTPEVMRRALRNFALNNRLDLPECLKSDAS